MTKEELKRRLISMAKKDIKYQEYLNLLLSGVKSSFVLDKIRQYNARQTMVNKKSEPTHIVVKKTEPKEVLRERKKYEFTEDYIFKKFQAMIMRGNLKQAIKRTLNIDENKYRYFVKKHLQS